MEKNFNLILTGVGGQGLITLVSVIDEAGLAEGYDVRSSELHGLSQRGGSVEIHIRMGKKVNSPLIEKGRADLVLGIELTESTRKAVFANPQTRFVVNKYVFPYLAGLPEDKLLEQLGKIKKENLHLVEASKICKEKLDKEVLSGMYLFGYAVYNKLIPISEKSALEAINKTIPEKYREMNMQAFNLAKN